MAMADEALVTALRTRLPLKEVVVFHCDHFEPYALDGAGVPIGAAHVAMLLSRLRAPERVGPPLSAFYGNQAFYHHGGAWHHTHRVMEDESILTELAAHDIDLHVHIHHENWTREGRPETECAALFEELLVKQLVYMRGRSKGLPAGGRWAFVHGCWALQASDPRICNLTEEIGLLYKHGCCADFSFPAGRRHCDPLDKHPRWIDPYHSAGVKGYDTAPTARHPAVGFLIWGSRVPFDAASLDLLADGSTVPQVAVLNWLRSAPIIDQTLYIKTHAHSLAPTRWQDTRSTNTPLLCDAAQLAFVALTGVCQEAGVPLQWRTVSEVLDCFLDAE